MSDSETQIHSQRTQGDTNAPGRVEYPARRLGVCLLLAAVTFVLYASVGRHEFVDYDDSDYVLANAHVQAGLTWKGVKWAFQTGHASNWHPLTWLSHMLDVECFGQNSGTHHLASVVLHCINAVLLLLVLQRMTGALWRSAFVAAAFALHPLHVESVAWVSERKDVLSTLFGFLTLWMYARYVEESKSNGPRSRVYYGAALFTFALGLMSKPMLVTWPCLLLLLDYWPLRRFEPLTPNSQLPTTLRLAMEKLPFFALAAASCVVTFLVQRKGGAVSPLSGLPMTDRISNALISYVRYLRKIIWPDDLSVLYPHPGHWPPGQVILAGVFLTLVTVSAVWRRRKAPFFAVGWFWFVGTLVPVIGLVQVGIQSMADRYTYVPLIGLMVGVAWGAGELVQRWPAFRPAFIGGAFVAMGACAFVTQAQIAFWRNSETLFRRAIEVTRGNYLAHNNLGFYLSKKGRIPEAMDQYRASLAINPNYDDALNNLGHALANQKKYAEAIEYYRAALRINPQQVEVHNNLGNALSETGGLDEAISHYLFVLQRRPEHADAHNNLGIALAMKGQLDEAIMHFQQAIRYKPGYASAHSNLGNALAVQRRFDEAIAEYETALRLAPTETQAHNNLGNALAETGRLEEAVAHYREALRLKSENPEAHFNLGCILARLNRLEEAIFHLNEAVRLRPDYSEAKNQLRKLRVPARP